MTSGFWELSGGCLCDVCVNLQHVNYNTGQDAGFIRFADAAACSAAAVATGAVKGDAAAATAAATDDAKEATEGEAMETTAAEGEVAAEAEVAAEPAPLSLGGAAAVTAVVEVRSTCIAPASVLHCRV